MNIVIVNENDEVIGVKSSVEEAHDDITRVSALWIYNSQNQVLLAQRALTKKYSPGKWGPAVSGTVEEGETYLSNIIKEAKEELGIDIAERDLLVGDKKFVTTKHRYFRQYFLAKVDLPIGAFTLPPDEVKQVRWVDYDELEQWLKDSPDDFTPSLTALFEEFKQIIDLENL